MVGGDQMAYDDLTNLIQGLKNGIEKDRPQAYGHNQKASGGADSRGCVSGARNVRILLVHTTKRPNLPCEARVGTGEAARTFFRGQGRGDGGVGGDV